MSEKAERVIYSVDPDIRRNIIIMCCNRTSPCCNGKVCVVTEQVCNLIEQTVHAVAEQVHVIQHVYF